MIDIDKIMPILLYLGIPIGITLTLVIAIVVALYLYPKCKLFMGDILKSVGWASKWIRRKSVESELEGSINSFTKHFNQELSLPLLPECSVEWVTADNAQTYIALGKAIMKVSFGEDHDTNYYNAANTFVETALLPRAKTYLHKTASKAIDLLLLRNLLSRSHRTALNVFNNRFRDEASETKERFYKCEETDQKGLFKRILLQEYYFWGESLGEKAPSESNLMEAEKFWEWFYRLATRESEEMTELAFRSDHINIGVILFAHSETYEKFGNSPYVKRAFTYVSNDCNCIYLLSRGKQKSRIVKEIAAHLVSTGCFESLSKNPDIERHELPNEPPTLITCIALKPSYPDIILRAWDMIRHAKNEHRYIVGTIKQVFKSGVMVDISGLKVEVDNKFLSSLDIQDARDYFETNYELTLRIDEYNQEKNYVLLSNIGTDSDPKWHS